MNTSSIHRFERTGADAACIDDPQVEHCGDVVIGRYGGCSASGARANEDGALVWVEHTREWEFAVLLDAHTSAESATLVIASISEVEPAILNALSQPCELAFQALERELIGLFTSVPFREKCRNVRGETACLIVARKAQFLWWLNVGDCMLFLLHPDLAAFGQRMLNQRNFFEWIGNVNTFNLPVPCYSSGVRELRTGRNVILMATDGLLHAVNPENPSFQIDPDLDLAKSVHALLQLVHDRAGADSATVIAWVFDNEANAAQPTVQA